MKHVIKPHQITQIREEDCIGCTKCIQACPVDAIVGASKLMHTVIQDVCTGCELCIPPCPVDCIDIIPVKSKNSAALQAFEQSTQARLIKKQKRIAIAAQHGETITEVPSLEMRKAKIAEILNKT